MTYLEFIGSMIWLSVLLILFTVGIWGINSAVFGLPMWSVESRSIIAVIGLIVLCWVLFGHYFWSKYLREY